MLQTKTFCLILGKLFMPQLVKRRRLTCTIIYHYFFFIKSSIIICVQGVSVSLHMSLTLLNREHFRSNIQIPTRRVVFKRSCPSHGQADIISIAELISSRPRYTDSNGEFLIEVSLARAKTVVEKEFLLAKPSVESLTQKKALLIQSVPSASFKFGSFAWRLEVLPEPLEMSDKICIHLRREPSPQQHINRMLANVRYRLMMSRTDDWSVSDIRQEMMYYGEKGIGWIAPDKLENNRKVC